MARVCGMSASAVICNLGERMAVGEASDEAAPAMTSDAGLACVRNESEQVMRGGG